MFMLFITIFFLLVYNKHAVGSLRVTKGVASISCAKGVVQSNVIIFYNDKIMYNPGIMWLLNYRIKNEESKKA